MKIVVATSFAVHPPRGGGQERIRGLFGGLARQGISSDVITLAPSGTRPRAITLAPGVREIRVPKSAEHEEAEIEISRGAPIPVTDIALARFHHLTEAYGNAVAAAAEDAAAVASSHPYPEPCLHAVCPDLPLIYEAQDVENDLKRDMMLAAADRDQREHVERLLAYVHECEEACCRRSAVVLTCSQADAHRLHELYDVPLERTRVAPNGCSSEDVVFTPPDQRAAHRRALGIEPVTALLVASWHGPNVDAAEQVAAAAEVMPDVHFLVAGSVGSAVGHIGFPENVDLLGVVHDSHLATLLGFVDVALNPMRFGSGTNLKMVRYAMAGVPIVSTEFGARGLGFTSPEHYFLAEPDGLADALSAFLAEPAKVVERRVERARDQALATLDWRAISAGLVDDGVLSGLATLTTARAS